MSWHFCSPVTVGFARFKEVSEKVKTLAEKVEKRDIGMSVWRRVSELATCLDLQVPLDAVTDQTWPSPVVYFL
jgi:hypothetical protein